MVWNGRQCHCGILYRTQYLILGIFLFLNLSSTSAANLDVYHPDNCPIDLPPDVFCSITAALSQAVNGDTIYIAPGVYRESPDLIGNRTLSIIGSGVTQTIIRSASTRTLLIRENVTIRNLTIEGKATKSGMGGAIYVNDNTGPNTTVNLIDVILQNSEAGMGAGIAIKSGIVNLLRTAIVNNTSDITAEFPTAIDASSGAGIFVGPNSTLVATDSVIANNTADVGNVLLGSAGGNGAGLYNLGTATLVNTTISGNIAMSTDRPGGGITNGNPENAATLNLHNVTIAGNSATTAGGGLYNVNGTVNISNSVIVDNSDNGSAPNCGGISFNSLGYNIVGATTGCTGFITTPPHNDVLNQPPNLLPLPSTAADSPFKNIPVFLSRAPAMGSLAIDGGDPSNCLDHNGDQLINDQRGATRPGINTNSNTCDIGAYEVGDDIIIFPPVEHVTFEYHNTSTVYVALAKQPAQTVQINISSANINEGEITTPTVIFNDTDWNLPKPVIIAVKNDGVPELADPTYNINFSTSDINNVQTRSLLVTNIDSPTLPGIVVDTNNITIQEGGIGATVYVKLATPPATDSVVNVKVINDQAIGQDSIPPEPNTITLSFTSNDWNVGQPFTVTAIDDTINDGDITYDIRLSIDITTTTDDTYKAVNDTTISINNLDNEVPSGNEGVTFFVETSIITANTTLITTEDGGQVTFTAQLNSAPTADVTLDLVSNQADEGLLLEGENPQQSTQLVFTPQNWNIPQSITVEGQDDNFADGTIPYTILTVSSSPDIRYNNLDIIDIQFVNNDNDVPGLIVTPASGLVTNESGTTANFQVSLSTPPVQSLQVELLATVLPPENQTELEGSITLPPEQLIFNSTNYTQPQTVTVIPLDDFVADGAKSYVINISVNTALGSTTSAPYRNSGAQHNIVVTNYDDEPSPQIIIDKTHLNTSESGSADSFSIVLATAPSAPVSINLTIPTTGESEGSFSSTVLDLQHQIIFNSSNWNTPQTVTVFGRDDGVVDGAQTYQIDIANAISTDPYYTNMVIPDVSVTNSDSDINPGIIASKSLLYTTEKEVSDSLTIQLATQPSSLVIVDVTISDKTEGSFEKMNSNDGPLDFKHFTFNSINWNIPQTVTIVGVDDSIDDGNKTYALQFNTSRSADTVYRNLNNADLPIVEVRNEDDDRSQPSDPGGGGVHYMLLFMLTLFRFYRRIHVY